MSNRDDTRLTCDVVRSLAFDARATDDREAGLTDERRAGFDRHLEDCSDCRAYVGQIDGMLTGAAQADPADWATDDADEAFDAVLDRVDARSDAGNATSETEKPENDQELVGVRGTSNEEPADGDASVTFRPRSYYAAAGLAAGIALTIAGFFAWRSLGPGAERTGPDSPSMSRTSDEADDESAGPKSDDDTIDDSTSPGREHGLDQLTRATDDERGIDVYASSDASWEMSGGDSVQIRLDDGTILVEYLPTETESLQVQTRETELRVTGTVFYVTTDGAWTSAGVAEGGVDVDVSDRDDPIRVEAGQRLGADYRIKPMSEEERAAIGSHIDLERHRERLETRPSANSDDSTEQAGGGGDSASRGPPTSVKENPEPDRASDKESAPAGTKSSDTEPTGEPAGTDLPGPVADLRREARAAMDRQEFAVAADKYESMLDRLPDDHDAVSSIHLDVARLYLRHLDRPESASEHLRTFVTRWPDDPAAESARGELCRVASELEREESLCGDGDADAPEQP